MASKPRRQENGDTRRKRARAARLIRAMVFAAKSDGHIDDKEQRAIQDKQQA